MIRFRRSAIPSSQWALCKALASVVAAFSLIGVVAAPAGAAGFVSGFGTGMQGWTCQPCGSGVGSLAYSSSGGNPGGHVTFVDGDSGSGESESFFMAPGTWAGDRSAYYNGTLSFDLRLNGAIDPGRGLAVLLIDPSAGPMIPGWSGMPTTDWGSFSVPLTEGLGWVSLAALDSCTTDSCRNSIPRLTRSRFKNLLANLAGVAILADYQSASGEQADLDNVALEPPTIAPRTLTIGYAKAQHAFRGKLTAAVAGCASNQPVSVYRVLVGPDQRLGSVTTTATGGWTLAHSAATGRYYARAVRTNLSPGTDCGIATSPALAVAAATSVRLSQ